MKTTHELARELLQLPDTALLVEGWWRLANHELKAVPTAYDPEIYILVQAPVESPRNESARV